MAVVINDFEVVAEPPATGVATAQQPDAPAGPPSAPEIERVLRMLAERAARLEAH